MSYLYNNVECLIRMLYLYKNVVFFIYLILLYLYHLVDLEIRKKLFCIINRNPCPMKLSLWEGKKLTANIILHCHTYINKQRLDIILNVPLFYIHEKRLFLVFFPGFFAKLRNDAQILKNTQWQNKKLKLKLQGKPLNVISLGPSETDYIMFMFTKSYSTSQFTLL